MLGTVGKGRKLGQGHGSSSYRTWVFTVLSGTLGLPDATGKTGHGKTGWERRSCPRQYRQTPGVCVLIGGSGTDPPNLMCSVLTNFG